LGGMGQCSTWMGCKTEGVRTRIVLKGPTRKSIFLTGRIGVSRHPRR
jgi:hypothetical protein